MEVAKDALDHVDKCMQELAISLDLIDSSEVLRRGTAGAHAQKLQLEAVKFNLGELSHAILALKRKE